MDRQRVEVAGFRLVPDCVQLLEEVAYALRMREASRSRFLPASVKHKLSSERLLWCRCGPNRRAGVKFSWKGLPDDPREIDIARYPVLVGRDTAGLCWVRARAPQRLVRMPVRALRSLSLSSPLGLSSVIPPPRPKLSTRTTHHTNSGNRLSLYSRLQGRTRAGRLGDARAPQPRSRRLPPLCH